MSKFPGNHVLKAPASSITVTANDRFYQGATLIGTATSAPYTINWTNVAAGSYSISAKATNNTGLTTTSAAVPIRVDIPPTISLTTPANAATYVAPASVGLAATASDSDGTVAKVDFYQGVTLIGTATTAPFTFTWQVGAAGNYALTAVATDNLGVSTTSAAINITVTSTKVYYLYPDQLGTPRLITDANNTIVWRNLPITEPFGNGTVLGLSPNLKRFVS